VNEVTIWHLEMNAADERVAKMDSQGMCITESRIKQFQVNRFLYQLVGADWQWHDKQHWSDHDWQTYVNRDSLKTWIAMVDGSIAGYFELLKEKDAVTEIAYFGLAPQFIGKGYGGYMLSEAIAEAWRWAMTERVIVNTCSRDHASALANYRARGFSLYREEKITQV